MVGITSREIFWVVSMDWNGVFTGEIIAQK